MRHFAVHSYDRPYYLPSVETGKHYKKDGRALLPLSITCRHAAADGWQSRVFWNRFNRKRFGLKNLRNNKTARAKRNFTRAVFSFDQASFAKIMRPAEVCSMLVTSAQTICPTRETASSTTTIVPSAR